MIYTVTFNPAIDYYITVDDLKIGEVNRATTEQVRFGGKGINVSLVLKEFNIPSIALGFIGGFTGEALEKHLKEKGIDCDFVKVSGNTRINVKLNDTDINAAGPDISEEELQALYKKTEKLSNGDFLVISGSVPKCLPQNTYGVILDRLKNKGINFVVDAERDLLLDALKYKPFLVKPNHHELGEIFGTEINNFKAVLLYAEKLKDMGAINVMVSMGDKGAVLVDENGNTYIQNAPSGKLVSAVGAGDSAVAAFLAEYIKSADYAKCLKYAVAAGSATAFSSGLSDRDAINKLYSGRN